MTHTLHFADSELARIEPTPTGCCLVFSAARVRAGQAGAIGGEGGDGWVRGLRLQLDDCHPTVADCAALPPGRLQAGELRQGPQVLAALALPAALNGPLTLTLTGPFHSELRLQAGGLRVALPPGAPVHDALGC